MDTGPLLVLDMFPNPLRSVSSYFVDRVLRDAPAGRSGPAGIDSGGREDRWDEHMTSIMGTAALVT